MGFQPFPVLEKGAKRQSDLPMLIAFGAGRERAGISQNIAPVLNKFRVAIERMIWRQCASNRRHDATYLDIRHRDAGDQLNLRLSFPESLVNIAHFQDLSRDPGCFPVSSSSWI